jgi:hypothetical protein
MPFKQTRPSTLSRRKRRLKMPPETGKIKLLRESLDTLAASRAFLAP